MAILSQQALSALTSFGKLVDALTAGDFLPVEQAPPWWEEGSIIEVTASDYDTYLEMLPPRFLDGHYFAYGEGSDPFTLFWKKDQQFFARQLSQAETARFCQLRGVRVHQ